MSDDLIYLLRRAAGERIRADAAACGAAKLAHLGLEGAYEARLRPSAPGDDRQSLAGTSSDAR